MTMHIRKRQIMGMAVVLILMSAGQARGDILDDILDLVKSAKTYALAARDRATEARNNAAAARDSANEMRDNLREGVQNLTDEIRTAISEGVEDLKQQLDQEREGLDDFIDGPDGCSAEACAPFRARLIDLLEQMESVFNAVLVISDAGDMQVDLARERRLISELPGRLLYPLYRSHVFDDATVSEALHEASDDLVIVAEVIQEDKEAACAYVTEHRDEVEDAIDSLERKARTLKLAAKLFTALGKIPIQPDAGAWGWVGIVVKLEPGEKIGTALDAIADALDSAAKSASKDMKGCVKDGGNQKVRKNQKRMMKDLKTALANQAEILEGQRQLQADVDHIIKILGG